MIILDIIGNKFSIDCELNQINKIVFVKVREFMEHNEYFHEEHFVEMLEEDYKFELIDVSTAPVVIITLAQLEDWVEEAVAEAEDECEDGDSSEGESDDDNEPFEEEDDDDSE